MKVQQNDVPDINDGNIYECPCGYGWDKTKVVRHHFCPNCGMPVDERVRSVDEPVVERVVDPEDCICRWEVLDLLRLQYFGKDLYIKIASLTSVKPRQMWIPADKELPEEGEMVLCWYEYFRFGDYNRMYQTFGIGYQYDGHWGGEVSNGVKAKVLYWMELPEPPEGAVIDET